MQAQSPDSPVNDFLSWTPRVGDLMVLCEENFGLLRRLAPELEQLTGRLCSSAPRGADLLLTVLDQAPYTTELRLTHVFPRSMPSEGAVQGIGPSIHPDAILHSDPDARLRVYHDACQVEVLDLRQTALPIYSDYRHPALAAKWRANLFLSKWLGYCVREGHCFPPLQMPASTEATLELTPSC
jgi:uncharacterized protein YqiB (DUF1249 family)